MGTAPVRLPRQGLPPASRRPGAVLVLCHYDPNGISTVPETVAYIQALSRFEVTVLNLAEHNAGSSHAELHPWVDLEAFDAIVIHNTTAYDVDNVRWLDRQLKTRLRNYEGVKVLMKQDENHRFKEIAAYVAETGFDVVFTCLPPEAIPLVYPGATSPKFVRMLTGYITPTLRGGFSASAHRPIDIGYRGSIQPVEFGWLAFEKRKIGNDVQRLLAGRGLNLDISSRWEHRFGGDRWLEFLRACKATLGAESGASIFDLHGDLQQRCTQLAEHHANVADEEERTRLIVEGLRDLEGLVNYGQVSPRHFEAAACGTLQLLFPGSYSGLFEAGAHYFELARDYSNLGEAVELLRDDRRRAEIVDRAFEEVVLNRRNWIEGFVDQLDAELENALSRRGRLRSPTATPPALNVVLLAGHDPVVDPRLGWIEAGAPDTIRIHQVGVLRNLGATPKFETTERGNLLIANPRWEADPAFWSRLFQQASQTPAGAAACLELQRIVLALDLRQDELWSILGVPPAAAARNADFIWYLHYILNTTATLLRTALECRGIHAVIATDMDSLLAALVLKSVFDVPVFYDAHEFWPEQDHRALEYEKDFWRGMEARLCPHADYRQTVSTGLAEFMSDLYGVRFESLPNCEPRNARLVSERPVRDSECRFLFQGNFAIQRGLELLIGAWPRTDPRAILELRGPESPYKDEMLALARATGLLDKRIFFPPAVPESELVSKAAESDVGLVPYVPFGAYRYCCPNKLSQYMAAGLPILANHTDFVAEVVVAAECGLVANFAREQELINAVDHMCGSPDSRAQWARSASDYFETTFNWNTAAAAFYGELERQASLKAPAPFHVYPQGDRRSLYARPATVQKAADPSPVDESRARRAVRRAWKALPESARERLRPVAGAFKKAIGLG